MNIEHYYGLLVLVLSITKVNSQSEDEDGDDGGELKGGDVAIFFFGIFFVSILVFCFFYLCIGDGRVQDKLKTLFEAPVIAVRKIGTSIGSMLPSSMRVMSTRVPGPVGPDERRENTQNPTRNPTFSGSLAEAIKQNQRLSTYEGEKRRNGSMEIMDV